MRSRSESGIPVLSLLRPESQGCSFALFHLRSILHCWSPPTFAYYTLPESQRRQWRFPLQRFFAVARRLSYFLEAAAATALDPGPDRQRSTMRIFVCDVEGKGDVDEARDHSSVVGCRFACDELCLSDSDDESDLHDQSHLMDKVGVVEGAFYELSHKHQAAIKETVRNQISALEMDVMDVRTKSASAIVWIEKYIEARHEMDRKLDILYRHNIAEVLDKYMAVIQRDHEYRSQIEETRIRNEAAFEEVRKEKILLEEKQCQEKAKAETKVVLELAAKNRAEEVKERASEDERGSKKICVEREVIKTSTGSATKVAPNEVNGHQIDTSSGILNAQLNESETDGTKKAQSAGNILKCADSALELEQVRLQKYKEFDEKTQVLRQRCNKDFRKHEISFVSKIRQISGHRVSIRKRGNELINKLNNPLYPKPINIAVFVKKFVSYFEEEKPPRVLFPCGHAIVFITSQVPYAMDFLLAELNKVCIYTVPKHIDFAKSAFHSEEDYHKRIGYRKENGTMESTENYLKRLESYMGLYAVLIQTETEGIQNPHGLREGWAWLARFLNALPANVYTGVALKVFLKMAGFALYRKYGCQFKKILKFISGNFLVALKAQGERVKERQLNVAVVEIESYIDEDKFLQEPEGWRLEGSLLSQSMVIQ